MKKGARTVKKMKQRKQERHATTSMGHLLMPYNVGIVTIPHDPVNAPQHYRAGDIYETIRVIEAWNLNFRLGNCVKYISRADNKGTPVEDLKKARWYLDREIQKRESQ